MVDNAVLTTGLVVILAGIALILLGGAAVVVHEGIQRRLDARAGVPAPGGGQRRVDASAADRPSRGALPEPAESDAHESDAPEREPA